MSTIATETKRPTVAPVELKDLFEHDVYSMIVDKLEERDAVLFFTSTKARLWKERSWFSGKYDMYNDLLYSYQDEWHALFDAQHRHEWGTPEYNILRRERNEAASRVYRQVKDELKRKRNSMWNLWNSSSKMMWASWKMKM